MEWENGKVKEGIPKSTDISRYDEKGFLKENIYITYNGSGKKSIDQNYRVISRDNKNRILKEDIVTSFFEPEYVYLYHYSQIEYTYKDKEGIAIAIYYSSEDGEVYEETQKTFFHLNEYGKIDGRNSETFSPELRKAASEETERLIAKSVAEYDEKGNVTVSYNLYRWDEQDVYIYNYQRYSYTYY